MDDQNQGGMPTDQGGGTPTGGDQPMTPPPSSPMDQPTAETPVPEAPVETPSETPVAPDTGTGGEQPGGIGGTV